MSSLRVDQMLDGFACSGGNPAVTDVFTDIERIGIARGGNVVDATWTNADGGDSLRRVRDAAAGSATSA